jgi:CHAD domain-containing protein
MQLTLLLSPADAARLQRLPNVKATRTGRSRGQAVRIVWHDTLDRALASRGLALCDQRGVWRLERYRPVATDPWPPATDHRVIQEADGPEALHLALADAQVWPEEPDLPAATTPVAAFEGRRTVVPLIIDHEPVSMTTLDGVLRAVAAERPVTRLIVEGPTVPVRTLVLSLAETLSLTVPEQSLAAEALCLADGTAPVPRRRGAPVLPPDGLSVHAAFGHIIGHLTDVILHLAPLVADAGTGPEPVHQMRVAVRRARSAFSLFRLSARPDGEADAYGPAVAAAAEGLKRMGQMLGPARDWDVFMTETVPPVEAVLPGEPALHALRRAGDRRRHAARKALGQFLTGPEFRVMSLELSCLASADAPVSETAAPGLAEFAAGVLRKRWKRLLTVGKALDDLASPELHGLRLKAKRLRYAAEFFAALFPEKSAARFIRRLSVLQERLGLFNDTSVAEGLLRELSAKSGYATGLVLGFTAARGVRARPKIAAAWARFRRRDAFWL